MGTFFFFSNETNLRYFISSPINYLSRWVMLKTYYLHLRRGHLLILLGEMQSGPHASSLFNPIKSGYNPLRKLSRARLRVWVGKCWIQTVRGNSVSRARAVHDEAQSLAKQSSYSRVFAEWNGIEYYRQSWASPTLLPKLALSISRNTAG